MNNLQEKNTASSINEQLIMALDNVRNKYQFPGATVAYVLSDGTQGQVATGFADVEKHISMKPESRMLAASVGKTFVSALLLALVHENKLSLNDLASKWLGHYTWFSRVPNHATITIYHLLTHTAGLPDHLHTPEFALAYKSAWSKPGNPFTPEEAIAFILDKSALSEPGQKWAYTDTGYLLLGLIIEAVTKNSYYDELQKRFLASFELRNTSPADNTVLENLAAGYVSQQEGILLPFVGLPYKTTDDAGVMVWNPAYEWTGGGLISNVGDMARWAKILYEGRALQGEYLSELLRGVAIDNDRSYGLGVIMYQHPVLGPIYGHYGLVYGYASCMRYIPKYKIAFAFQINTDIGISDRSTPVMYDMESKITEILVAAAQRVA